MVDCVRFVGRLAMVRKDKLGIIIPESILKNEELSKVLRRWYEEGRLLVIEIKELHGMVKQ